MPLPSDHFVWMTKGEQRAEVRNNASVPIMERQGWRVAGHYDPTRGAFPVDASKYMGAPEVPTEAPAAASAPEAVAVAEAPKAAPAPTWGKKGRK